MINFSHWLGAVITSYDVIGTKYTPVRRVIDKAAAFIDRPKLCFSLVVKGEDLAGLYIGAPEEAYEAACSDAHKPAEVGMNFAEAIQLARSVGYKECRQFCQRKFVAIKL